MMLERLSVAHSWLCWVCQRIAFEDFLRDSKLASLRFHRMTRQILSMSIPVCILCGVILLYEEIIVRHASNTHIAMHMLVYKESSEVSLASSNAEAELVSCRAGAHICDRFRSVAQDSTLHKFRGSLLNGLTVLGAIVAITVVFIVLYMLEWRRALRSFLTGVICALMLPWLYFS